MSERLTAARVFGDPPLSGAVPTQVRISADGRWVFYLANPADDRERLDLYGHEVASNRSARLVEARVVAAAGALSEAEKAERERRRQFTRGVTAYVTAPDGARVAFLADGAVHLLAVEDGDCRRVSPPGRHTDLRWSRTGRHLSWVRDGELFTFDLDRGEESRRTQDAGATVTNGVADFVAQEEMHRFDGHWWSVDDAHLAFTRVDTAPVAETWRYEFQAQGLAALAQRYPYAGARNAEVRLGLLDVGSGTTRWIDWADREDDYLARAGFCPGRLWVQVQNRDQTRLRLKAFDVARPVAAEVWLEETHPTWVNLHDNLHFLPGGRDFVWSSERDGLASLYLYCRGETPLRLTTRGRVNRVVRVDATHVYYLGWEDHPTEQHLFRVALSGPERRERLTRTPGWHEAAVEPGARWFVDRHASLARPPHVQRVPIGADDEAIVDIAANALGESHPYTPFHADHALPQFGRLQARDGQTLWYRLTRPRALESGRRCPVIVHVYGGPGVQRVVDDWAPLTLQLLARAGYAVFELDNRGTGNREKRFEDPIHRRLGVVEVEDQLVGVQFLRSLPWVDADRIAVFGHSYGGYLALKCLIAGNGAFRCAVSSAPVTDWRLYDTHYTERYLGTPQDNPAGYAESAVSGDFDGVRGALLLMHGMADDNVLFDHSARLMGALQRGGVQFELMLYPGAKHAMQEREVAIHRFETLLSFLSRHLA